jgi:hypothetical protein
VASAWRFSVSKSAGASVLVFVVRDSLGSEVFGVGWPSSNRLTA